MTEHLIPLHVQNPPKRPKRLHWTRKDDDKLLLAIENWRNAAGIRTEQKVRQWHSIAYAAFHNKRTAAQCRARWATVLNPNVSKWAWTKEEDEKLRKSYYRHLDGYGKWSKIAKYIPGRTGKQCRERWTAVLSPDIVKSPWTDQEDEVIRHAYNIMGSRWAEMEKLLVGRTQNAIKNRWHSHIKRNSFLFPSPSSSPLPPAAPAAAEAVAVAVDHPSGCPAPALSSFPSCAFHNVPRPLSPLSPLQGSTTMENFLETLESGEA